MSDPTGTTAIAEPTANGAVASAEPGRAVETLQKQVREKDQLVAALTERLEQAAEQLDRLRRTGVDKGHRPLAGAVSPELIQDQKQTLEELKKFIGNWDEIKPGDALQRIETQVVEIRNLIASGVTIASPAPTAATPVRDRPIPTPSTAAPSAPSGGKSTSPSSWWEKQKAAMLGEGPEPTEESATAAAPSAASSTSGEDSSAAPAPCSLGDTVIPDLPAAVNFDELTLDEAKQAIRDRDQLIQQLREPLLLLKAAGQLPRDLQSLDHLPAALRQRLEELEAQWQARFRQAELEMSLERARLAREQSQTRQQQELLTKQIKQTGSAQREQDEVGDSDDGSSRRRWFRFMGKTEGGKEPASGEPK